MTNKKQRRGQALREVLVWLKATWPAAFTEPPSPLALGVHRAIHESAREVETKPAMVTAALGTWCNRISYIRAVADGGHRVSLDGSQGEQITPEQREHARQRIRQHQVTARQKRKARQQREGLAAGVRQRCEPTPRPAQIAPRRVSTRRQLTLRRSK